MSEQNDWLNQAELSGKDGPAEVETQSVISSDAEQRTEPVLAHSVQSAIPGVKQVELQQEN